MLNDKEIKRLIALGGKIKHNLSCDINGDGLPCRSDRLSAVKLMRKYIDIHDVKDIPVITGDSDTDELLEIERCNQESEDKNE